MDKAELIEIVSNKRGIPKKEAENVLDGVIETIAGALSRGEKVTLVGFGTFQVQERKAREGVSPQTGDKIILVAETIPKSLTREGLREKLKGTLLDTFWKYARIILDDFVITVFLLLLAVILNFILHFLPLGFSEKQMAIISTVFFWYYVALILVFPPFVIIDIISNKMREIHSND